MRVGCLCGLFLLDLTLLGFIPWVFFFLLPYLDSPILLSLTLRLTSEVLIDFRFSFDPAIHSALVNLHHRHLSRPSSVSRNSIILPFLAAIFILRQLDRATAISSSTRPF